MKKDVSEKESTQEAEAVGAAAVPSSSQDRTVDQGPAHSKQAVLPAVNVDAPGTSAAHQEAHQTGVSGDEDVIMDDVEEPHNEVIASAPEEPPTKQLPPPPPLAPVSVVAPPLPHAESDLSATEPPKWLLPPVTPALKGRKCLVLDLDETLVHSSFKVSGASLSTSQNPYC
jgi:RNA polymerase II subunit A small phosphatase-like protein